MRTRIGRLLLGWTWLLAAWSVHAQTSPAPIALTPDESAWVAAHATLRIGYSDSAPITFQDSRGKASGLAVEMVEEACRRAGLQPAWVFFDDWPSALEALAHRDVDALGNVSAGHLASGDPVTQPCMPLQNAILLRQNSPFASSIEVLGRETPIAAVIDSTALAALERRYPGQKLVPRKSIPDVLEALRSGTADAAVGNLATSTTTCASCASATCAWRACSTRARNRRWRCAPISR